MHSKGRIVVLKIMLYSEQRQISGLVVRHQPRERDEQEQNSPVRMTPGSFHVLGRLLSPETSELERSCLEYQVMWGSAGTQLVFCWKLVLCLGEVTWALCASVSPNTSALTTFTLGAQDREHFLLWWLEEASADGTHVNLATCWAGRKKIIRKCLEKLGFQCIPLDTSTSFSHFFIYFFFSEWENFGGGNQHLVEIASGQVIFVGSTTRPRA